MKRFRKYLSTGKTGLWDPFSNNFGHWVNQVIIWLAIVLLSAVTIGFLLNF